MDAYLADESRRLLETLIRLSPRSRGLLFGRKRGFRFIVEAILPLPGELRPTIEALMESGRTMHRDLLGWFHMGEAPEGGDSLFNPYMTGKLLLGIQCADRGEIRFRPRMIEYRDTFTLVDIDLHQPETSNHHD